MATYQETIDMIEAYIKDSNLTVAGTKKLPANCTWFCAVDKTVITISLSKDPKQDIGYLSIFSPIPLKVADATKREALYGELLELNARFLGFGFALHKEALLLRSVRSSVDLDAGELKSVLVALENAAQKLSAYLKEKYGGPSLPDKKLDVPVPMLSPIFIIK